MKKVQQYYSEKKIKIFLRQNKRILDELDRSFKKDNKNE